MLDDAAPCDTLPIVSMPVSPTTHSDHNTSPGVSFVSHHPRSSFSCHPVQSHALTPATSRCSSCRNSIGMRRRGKTHPPVVGRGPFNWHPSFHVCPARHSLRRFVLSLCLCHTTRRLWRRFHNTIPSFGRVLRCSPLTCRALRLLHGVLAGECRDALECGASALSLRCCS